MSEIRVNNLSNESSTGGPTITGITTFSGTNFFVPPVGNIAQRPENPEKGSLRYNTELGVLEYYRGDTIGWSEVEAIEAAPLGARGIFAGGNGPATRTAIDYITITTTGNAQDFGDSDVPVDVPAGAANLVRGIVAGGYKPAPAAGDTANISMLTIATLGNTTTWGTLSSARRNRDGCGDHSRGVFMSGYPTTAQIDYLTFMSTGTSIDFGDTTQSRYNPAAVSDATRAVCCGGHNPATNICDYVTIQSTGNSQDFGDLVTASSNNCGHSSSTRGIIGMDGTEVNYITIATTGNAADFGNVHDGNHKNVTGSSTRCCLSGGYTPTQQSTIQYVTMATLGNGDDFGDLTATRSGGASFSNSGGGL